MANKSYTHILRFLLSSGSRIVLIAMFSVGAAFGAGIWHGFIKAQGRAEYTADSQVVTLVEYERIKEGMTLTDVRAILGRGTEISRAGSLIQVEWKNNNGSMIVATFQDSILSGKEQSELASVCSVEG